MKVLEYMLTHQDDENYAYNIADGIGMANSYTNVYIILKEMEDEGLVSGKRREEKRQTAPIYYTLTLKGKEAARSVAALLKIK